MNINIESYKNISSVSKKKYKQFLALVDECFPYVFSGEDEIYLNFVDSKLDLILDDNLVVGFVSYGDDVKNTIDINYLGVKQDKKYLNQGIATMIINNFINKYPNSDLLLHCRADNDRARYLYHKLGFEVYGEGNSSFYGHMYQLALNTNKKYKGIASVLYELYKENKRRDNETLEETLFDMYQNKLYDNIYQYDMSEKEIDKVIMNSKLFVKCVSILDEAIDDGVKENELFSKIESNLGLSLYDDVFVYKCLFEASKQEMKDLHKIFGLVNVKQIDDQITKTIKSKR